MRVVEVPLRATVFVDREPIDSSRSGERSCCAKKSLSLARDPIYPLRAREFTREAVG